MFSIGPGQQISFALRELPKNYEQLRSEGKLKFKIMVEYLDISNNPFKKDIDINLEIYHGLRFPTQKVVMAEMIEINKE